MGNPPLWLIKGQYESNLPANIWRINTWSKSIVKSDGNHHVCRFLLVLFVCQIVNITLWNPKTCGSSSTRYSKKRHVGAEGNRKKRKTYHIRSFKEGTWRNTQKMTSSQVLKEAVCKGHDQPPIRLSLWWQYEHRRRTSFGGHEIHWRCIKLVSKMVGGLEHVFPIQLGIITPTDFHFFQRGSNHQPENMCSTFSEYSPMENHPLTLMILRANPGVATAAHVLHDERNSLRENPRGTLVFACFYHTVSQFPASFALVSKSHLQLIFLGRHFYIWAI